MYAVAPQRLPGDFRMHRHPVELRKIFSFKNFKVFLRGDIAIEKNE